ncbi:MAG: hypothetical protein GQ581_04215 [Methyloprofundus sp.]|nr:hypothetical protein [Methyloprofundus sp.]
MKSFKSTIIALLMSLFLGSFATLAFADRNSQAVDNISAHIDEAIKSIDANNVDAAMAHIKEAKRAKKELNSEGNAAKIGRLSAHFNKAKKLLKKSDLDGAKSELEKAKHGYNAIKF